MLLLSECLLGLPVRHESGAIGIIIKEPYYDPFDKEYYVEMISLRGILLYMWPRRLSHYQRR